MFSISRCSRIDGLYSTAKALSEKMVAVMHARFISDVDTATTKEAEYMLYFQIYAVHFQCVDCLLSHLTKLCSNGRTFDTRCASLVLKTQGSLRQKRLALLNRSQRRLTDLGSQAVDETDAAFSANNCTTSLICPTD